MIRLLLGTLIAASSAAQPGFEPGGEASTGFVVLWEGKSTGDGFDAHAAPRLCGQFGAAMLGPVIGVISFDWMTFATSKGSGPVSVDTRHQLFGIGPHVSLMDRSYRAGLAMDVLLDVVSTENSLEGSAPRSASGTNVGLRYGFESVVRFGALPLTSGLTIAGQRRDGRDDIFLGLTFGWIWGALSPPLEWVL